MMRKNIFIHVLSFIVFWLSATLVNAQSNNMLNNPFADEKADYWIAVGYAMIEEVNDDPCFVIRYGGYFTQDITLNENEAGKFVLLIGLASSERVKVDGKITGLPYLYGYMLGAENVGDISSSQIFSYLQGSDMLYSSSIQSEWVVIWDVFEIQEYTKSIRIFLNQASQRGVPHNGSAALFDELGVYLFASLNEATAFVDQFYYH